MKKGDDDDRRESVGGVDDTNRLGASGIKLK